MTAADVRRDAPRTMTFTRADQRWNLASVCIVGIAADPVTTPIPSAPTALLGLLGWRGHVVPVVDAPQSTGAAEAPRAAIIVDTSFGLLGLAADDVLGWSGRPDAGVLLEPEQLYRRMRKIVHAGAPPPLGGTP